MGLQEKRAVANFKTNKYPELKKKIDAAAQHEVLVEVDWDSITQQADGYSTDYYDEAFTKVYFDPLIAAFNNICIDDMGRDALKSVLKKITIRSTGGRDIVFDKDSGVLDYNYHPVTNVDYVEDRTKEVQGYLESAM